MNQWEVFVNDVKELVEDTDLELTIRTLNPGMHKFTYKRVRCSVSADLKKHADQLQVRLNPVPRLPRRHSVELTEHPQLFLYR